MTLALAVISRVTRWLENPVVPSDAGEVDIKVLPAASGNIGPGHTIDWVALFPDLWRVHNWLVSDLT